VVEAPGGKLGTHGDFGCFSFHATKNVTTGEGGMVVARDPGTLRRIRLMRSHHLTTSTEERARSGDVGYDVPGLGLNYRPTEISAALGHVQLDRLPTDRVHRRELVALYRTLLGEIPGIEIPFAGREGDSAFHLMAILLPAGLDREAVRAGLTAAGIQTSMHYPPTHRFSFYRRLGPRAGRALPVTEAVAPRLLSLPLHSRMSDDDVAFVCDAVSRAAGS
jgi:dTDP-4-amino-4,6-dideoxygalactose transaminase